MQGRFGDVALFQWAGVLSVGVLIKKALLFGIHIRAPDLRKLSSSVLYIHLQGMVPHGLYLFSLL